MVRRSTLLLCVVLATTAIRVVAEVPAGSAGSIAADPPLLANTPAVEEGRRLFRRFPAASDADARCDLYNARACSDCHTGTSHARGPATEGRAPTGLVIKLASVHPAGDPPGDPVYGRVFNTVATSCLASEGVVNVQYRDVVGVYYPSGESWRIRAPTYELRELQYGPLSSSTVIQPRIAPSLFGLGYLARASIPANDTPSNLIGGSRDTGRGRFGWQAEAPTLREQIAKALALEMGLSNPAITANDCTRREPRCTSGTSGPVDVGGDALDALQAFVEAIGIPPPPGLGDEETRGRRLFREIGCAACHLETLPSTASDSRAHVSVSPFTDLQLHDLGVAMADRDVGGKAVASRWRTAPLWGIGYRLSTESHPTFLHDGRARTVEEAVLWHQGEASRPQARFSALSPGRRALLLRWIEAR